MDQLKRLGLISKVARLLAPSTNVCDRDLAEYVLNLSETDPEALRQELTELGALNVLEFLTHSEQKQPAATASYVPTSNEESTGFVEASRAAHAAASQRTGIDAREGRRTVPEESLPRRSREQRRELKLGETYEGKVSGITKFGAFVTLQEIKPKTDGLVHISELADHRVNEVSDVVRIGDVVRPRLIKIDGKRLSLSLKSNSVPQPSAAQRQSKKRLSSPERFEIRQLIAAGTLSASDYPEVEENDEEEHLEVQVHETKPTFLNGETLPTQPISFARTPDGAMAKLAAHAGELAKQRVESRPSASKSDREWKKALSRPLGKVDTSPIAQQRRRLPVYNQRQALIDAIRANPVVIIVGETGSGKTTQITQYLYEEGFAERGLIGCTQPRRVAAKSIAQRVAEETSSTLGDLVGYSIRFENCTGPQTRIKYMTDGMLQHEVLADPDVRNYSVLMLDEAHERTLATDVLLPLVKSAATRRPDLHLIITSATLDSAKFSEYFGNAPVLEIPGRTFPVEIVWPQKLEPDYLSAALMQIMQIHMAEPEGDILVFLTGQEEIETACERLFERIKALGPAMAHTLEVMPVYSALPSEMQSRIFEVLPKGVRKCILATNIAETSLTIDGIRYVVDPGFVKLSAWDPQLGMNSLRIVPISRAQANQRAGRAGRTAPGKCFRLYPEQIYQDEMSDSMVPEIQRQNLAHTALMLKAMGISDLLKFDFLDPPPKAALVGALVELYQLGAVDGEGLLTRVGRKMADFPMDPAMAKVLIRSADAGCAQEMLTVVAMLSMPSVFYRPSDAKQRDAADRARRRLGDSTGDHMTLLNVYTAWARSGYSKQWCVEHYVHERTLRRAKDVRQQLAGILQRYQHRLDACGGDAQLILQVIASGYFRNAAKLAGTAYHTLVDGTEVAVHPASALFGKRADYVLYHTLVFTSREYMHNVSAIRASWLLDAAPAFFEPVTSGTKRRRTEAIKPLFNRFAEHDDDWRISAQKKYVKYESQSF